MTSLRTHVQDRVEMFECVRGLRGLARPRVGIGEVSERGRDLFLEVFAELRLVRCLVVAFECDLADVLEKRHDRLQDDLVLVAHDSTLVRLANARVLMQTRGFVHELIDSFVHVRVDLIQA